VRYSTIDALLAGVCKGGLTIAQLGAKGNVGMGTCRAARQGQRSTTVSPGRGVIFKDVMDSIELLKKRWKAEGIELLPGEPALQVHMAFASAGATPAADVLALYRNIGGMAYMDEEYWRLWSLDEIIEENAKRSNVGVQFSDYMMSCWHFTVKAVDATRSEVWIDSLDGNGPLLVASSLSEFFDIYVSAYPTRVLDPGHFKRKKAC
jgi:hypothetical protein